LYDFSQPLPPLPADMTRPPRCVTHALWLLGTPGWSVDNQVPLDLMEIVGDTRTLPSGIVWLSRGCACPHPLETLDIAGMLAAYDAFRADRAARLMPGKDETPDTYRAIQRELEMRPSAHALLEPIAVRLALRTLHL